MGAVESAAATVLERLSACSSERMPWLLISRVGMLSLRRVAAAALKSGAEAPCEAQESFAHSCAVRGSVAEFIQSIQ